MQCPSCGAALPEGTRLCPTCGRVLVGPEPLQREAPSEQIEQQPGVAPPYFASQVDHKPLLAWNHVVAAIPLAVAVLAIFMTLAVAAVCLLLRRDWADSAAVAAIVGLFGVVAVVIALVPLLILRRFERVSLGLTALWLAVIVIGSVGALTQQSALHRTEAQFLEDAHIWSGAVDEYRRSGERPGHAPNMARVHLKWGEQLLGQKKYADAVTIFGLAQLDDERVTTQERAERGIYHTYMGWLVAKPPDKVWREIASFLERYMTKKLCDTECQKTIRPSVALAYYQSGRQIQKTELCSDAVTLYRRLASDYADTPSGQQAAVDLAEPVSFKATIVNLPSKYKGVSAHLSRKVSPEDGRTVRSISRDYQATLDTNDRATFTSVAAGKYNFSIDLPRGEQYEFEYWHAMDAPYTPYTEVVAPLCGGVDTFSFS
jgi:hypothetical protein